MREEARKECDVKRVFFFLIREITLYVIFIC